MLIGDELEGAIPELREQAESRHRDSFKVEAFTEIVVDGLKKKVWVEQFTTPGRVAGRSREAGPNTRFVTVGGVERPVTEAGIRFPVSKPRPEVGWRITCTAVGRRSDLDLVDQKWLVEEAQAKSDAVERRLDVVEV